MKNIKVSKFEGNTFSSSITVNQVELGSYIDGYTLYARKNEKSNETASILIKQVGLDSFQQELNIWDYHIETESILPPLVYISDYQRYIKL